MKHIGFKHQRESKQNSDKPNTSLNSQASTQEIQLRQVSLYMNIHIIIPHILITINSLI
jgi:hypothetical protein